MVQSIFDETNKNDEYIYDVFAMLRDFGEERYPIEDTIEELNEETSQFYKILNKVIITLSSYHEKYIKLHLLWNCCTSRIDRL